MPSTVETAAEFVGRALHPLVEALDGSDEDVAAFVALLGWNLPSVPPALKGLQTALGAVVDDLGSLQLARTTLEEGTGSEDDVLLAIGLLAADIAVVALAIEQLPTQLRAQLPQSYLDSTHIADQILDRMFHRLLATLLREESPLTYQLVYFLGFFEAIAEPEDATVSQPAYTLFQIRLDRVAKLFSDPKALFADVYGWGTPTLNTGRLFLALQRLSTAILGPARLDYPDDVLIQAVAPGAVIPADTGPDPVLIVPLIEFAGITASLLVYAKPTSSPTEAQGLVLVLVISGDITIAVPLTDMLTLIGETQADLSTGLGLIISPGQGVQLLTGLSGGAPVAFAGKITLTLQYANRDGAVQLLAISEASGLQAQQLYVRFGAALNSSGGSDMLIETGLVGGKLVISPKGVDGFLKKILPPDGVNVDFEFGLGWSKARGVYFSGSAGLEAEIGLHVSIGPFKLDSLHLALAAAAAGLKLETSLTGKGILGPVSASVERIGLSAKLDFHSGNLGPVDAGVEFKPPSGLGIVVDAGVVTGGGFISFDPPNGRYAGGLELKIEEIVVKAFGLLDTKLPDGKSGFSFLIIITAEFTPIQLGFGFTLNGVGGLAGINRTLMLDALQAGFRAHSITSILFPDIHNAQKIISDLRTIFPPAEGRYVFGPMVEIGWGTPTLVAAQIGIVLEVPAPIRLAILGLILAALPEDDGEDTVVLIHLDVLGTVDFGLKKLAIDASIYDSRIVVFSLFGDMAMRLSWGADPTFAFSLGGLHPQFQPPPAFPHLRRLTLSIGDGDNPRLSLTTYMAVTSNTVQFGADLELYAAYGGFKVHGYLAFDALFVISPFSFITEMSAGVDVQFNGVSLCGIGLDFILTGPTPWTYNGTATLHFLFFSVSAGVSGSFGSGTAKELPAEPVMEPLLKALNDARSWTALLPEGTTRGVSFSAPKPDDTTLYVHPTGQLTVRQTVVPLSTRITKFGSARPSDGSEFKITAATLTQTGSATPVNTTPVSDPFARAQFEDMNDGDRLAAKSYEPFPSGVTLGDPAVEAGNQSTLDLHYETQIIDDVFLPARKGALYHVGLELQGALAKHGAGELSPLRATGNARYKQPGMTSPIATPTPGFVITSVDDLSVRYDITGGAATTQRAAGVQLEAHIARNPQDAGRFQIMPVHEVAA
jgi:uncharacterized protein DUF6603